MSNVIIFETFLRLLASAASGNAGPGSILNISGSDVLHVWKNRDNLRPFIFEVDSKHADKFIDTIVDKDVLPNSLPFPFCWFEYSEERSLIKRHIFSKRVCIDVYAALFIEKAPNEIEAIAILNYADDDGDKSGNQVVRITQKDTQWEALRLNQTLTYLLDRLRNSDIANEKVNIKVKAKLRSGTEFAKVKRVVRVVPRAKKKQIAPILGGSIDWDHRWEVMGHWRRTSGVGKNRSGDYCIKGFTWVNDHVKGPAHLPVIPKIRVVIDQKDSA